MNELVIIARIESKKEKIELVKAALIKLLEPTRKEKGCLQYELNQDNENQEIFMIFEIWTYREIWQTHMKNAHLKHYMQETEGAVTNFTINEMTNIE
jgi:quinol monooxygenase YgiN